MYTYIYIRICIYIYICTHGTYVCVFLCISIVCQCMYVFIHAWRHDVVYLFGIEFTNCKSICSPNSVVTLRGSVKARCLIEVFSLGSLAGITRLLIYYCISKARIWIPESTEQFLQRTIPQSQTWPWQAEEWPAAVEARLWWLWSLQRDGCGQGLSAQMKTDGSGYGDAKSFAASGLQPRGMGKLPHDATPSPIVQISSVLK